MLRTSFAGFLAKVSQTQPCRRINVGLSDGNRLSLANWTFAGDCLVERWPDNGGPRYLVPLSQVVSIEVMKAD